MFYAQPATAGADAFERLALFMTEPPTPFDLHRLAADARALENADLSEAYTVRSGIAALKWDVEEVRNWCERACLADGTATAAVNASISCRYVNRIDWAVEYALQALKLAALDHATVSHAIGMLATEGKLAQLVKESQAYRARRPGQPSLEFDAEALVEAMGSLGVGESQLQHELAAAMEVLTSEKIRHRFVRYLLEHEPDGNPMLVVLVAFPGDIDTEMRLESKLAHRLVETPQWDPSKLSVEFEYQAQVQHAGNLARAV